MSTKHTPSTRRRIQDRRQDLSKPTLNTTATNVHQEAPQQSVVDIQRIDSHFLPRRLTRLPSLGYYSPSPESESTPELHHPFQSLLDIGSNSEGSLSTECPDSLTASTGTPDSSLSLVQEPLPLQWFSTSSDLDSSLQSLEDLTSESEKEDEDEGRSTSWHGLRSESSLQMFSPSQSLGPILSQRALPPQDSRASYNRIHRRTQPLVAPSRASSRASITRGGTTSDLSNYRLPALNISPGRSPLAVFGRTRMMESSSLDPASSRLEDREDEVEAIGGRSFAGGWSTEEATQPSTASLMDHLALTVMALHELRIAVTHSSHNAGRSGSAEPERPRDPETLRRITESLLQEESDEEDEDVCRICQCKGASPTNPLLSPCQCAGSLQYVHHDCLKRWIQTKITSGAELSVVKTCELCKGSLTLDLEEFDVDEYYCRHRSTQIGQDIPELQRFFELLQLARTHNRYLSQALGSLARR